MDRAVTNNIGTMTASVCFSYTPDSVKAVAEGPTQAAIKNGDKSLLTFDHAGQDCLEGPEVRERVSFQELLGSLRRPLQ